MSQQNRSEVKAGVFNWWQSVKSQYEGVRVTNQILTEVFLRDNPYYSTYSIETVLKYVTKCRAGEIKPEQFDSIRDTIMGNIQTAQSVFNPTIEVDLNPLGVLDVPDMNKVFFDVPETYASYLAPMNIECDGLLGVASDMHFPIHNREAVLACFGKLKELNISGLYLNGDIIDCASVGHHDKRKVLNYTWDQELAVARAFLKSLRVLFPTIPIWYKSGNHEDWLPRYLAKVAPQLANEYGLAEALGLKDLNITYVESSRASASPYSLAN